MNIKNKVKTYAIPYVNPTIAYAIKNETVCFFCIFAFTKTKSIIK